MGLELFAEHLFCIGAGERPGNIDPLAHLPVFHPRADGADNAGSVETGCVRKFQVRTVHSRADIGIDRVDSCGVQLDNHLRRTGGQPGDLLQLHHFRFAECVNTNRFHCGSPLYPFSFDYIIPPEGGVSARQDAELKTGHRLIFSGLLL
jgi:hypothetical protein